MARFSLASAPSQHPTKVIDFPQLNGGLNLWDMDYHLPSNQSPEMRNMWWEDGIIQSRVGQLYAIAPPELGVGHTCFAEAFWDHAFFHIGSKLYCVDLDASELSYVELCDGVPEVRGTFFRYGDDLYYKTVGSFLRIKYNSKLITRFAVGNVADDAYVPIIVMNADPVTGAGDTYQPENRLSAKKTVRFNAKTGVTTYKLPVREIDSVDEVKVDGVAVSDVTDFTTDLTAGTVTFNTEPPVQDPPVNNTVEITYSKSNVASYEAVMGCRYAAVYGAGTEVCMVLGGCEVQPNGVFWNGNDSFGMNPAYWPVSFYNLAGDTEDMVTGFGKQYSELLVFKERSVGKLKYSLESIDGRDSISLTYENVNSKIGCDLPWTIQLIENNLVFCNSRQGVFIVRDSSAAYENNIQSISRNVNGEALRPGLLADIRFCNPDEVCSFDDDVRYWVCVNSHVYVWDYTLSSYKEPSWFYMTNMVPVGFLRSHNRNYHLNKEGALTRLENCFSDYGEGIDKVYKFPAQNFGTYDRLKDVLYCIFSVRHDTDSLIDIEYHTDYGKWVDQTGIRSYSWRLAPRNLAFRCLRVLQFAHVDHRKPGARHVRHFALRLSNNVAGQDLAIVSAQIYFRYLGKDR